jgi:hypothetical protein
MSLIHNERIKLLATAFSNMAVATMATAIVAPTVGFLYGPTNPATNRWWLVIGIVWLLLGVGLHMAAQYVLGRLRE